MTAQLSAQSEITRPSVPDHFVRGLGRLPLLTLVGAIGLLLIASADTGGRVGQPWASLVFWEGLLILFAPIAARLFSSKPSRQERIGLLVMLGLGLYMVKVLHSPTGYNFTDELLHWRTAQDIGQTHHLFTGNSLLPVSPYYPGLELVTNALVSLSGLSIYEAGVLVVGAARIIEVLALYLLFEQIPVSQRVASIATMLYMTNSSFIFFSAEFSYESLALPLAVATLYILVYRLRAPATNRLSLNLTVLLCIGAVLVTHHVTSYMLVGILILWATLARLSVAGRHLLSDYRKYPPVQRLQNYLAGWIQPEHITPVTTPILGAVASLAWTVSAASLTIRYLATPIVSGITDFARMLGGEGTSRQLFTDFAGLVAPIWERLAGYDAVGLVGIGILLGLFAVWRSRRWNALVLACALAAIVYPGVQALRLSASAWEIASRASEYLFIGVALIIALGMVYYLKEDRKLLVGIFTAWASILLVGGLTLGWPYWARLPGSYLVSADTRSLDDKESIAAANWVGTYLPAESQVGSDRVNRLLMGTLGNQEVVTNIGGQGNVAFIFMASNLGIAERSFIHNAHLSYLVADYRLTKGLPVIGIYFEKGEPDTYTHVTPLAPEMFAKFEGAPDISRSFDSGSIVIYDVSKVYVEP